MPLDRPSHAIFDQIDKSYGLVYFACCGNGHRSPYNLSLDPLLPGLRVNIGMLLLGPATYIISILFCPTGYIYYYFKSK